MKPTGNRGPASILIASDWAPIRAFDTLIRREPPAVYGDLLPVLGRADLRVVNCECALTTARRPVWKSGSVFKGAPAHIGGLKAVPFEVACLANNHVFDYGLPGFRETVSLLRRNGIRTVGAGLSEQEAARPLTLKVKGNRLSILNFSEGEDLTSARGGPGVRGWDIEGIASQVARLKRRGDCVLAVGHCGLEYIPFPPPYVQDAFRRLVDAGADAVVGHHPHVPQGIEVYGGKPIAYSLGNFVFYQATDLYYRRVGTCLELRVEGNKVVGWDVIPYRITDTGLYRLKGGEETAFRRDLRQISRPLKTSAGVRQSWGAYLAFYGLKGFREEVLRISEVMKKEPRKGAAMFRNRLTTMQHAELWRDTLSRFISGPHPPVPAELARIVHRWLRRTT